MSLTFGSLFSGIGGIDLGLERAGMRCAWQVEIDAYCKKVLAKHWPDVARYGDIRTVGAHNLAPVDLIAGGFPCQDISDAGIANGKRRGLDGERSGLWAEYFRIICELQPRYVLVENVAALLVRGMGRVLGDLASIGYDAEWQVLRASDVGAPHRRERVFIVAYAPSKRPQRIFQKYQLLSQSRAVALTTSRLSTQRRKDATRHLWQSKPDVVRVADGVPFRVQRLRGLGNAVVPQVAEYVGRCILDTSGESEAAS